MVKFTKHFSFGKKLNHKQFDLSRQSDACENAFSNNVNIVTMHDDIMCILEFFNTYQNL